MVLPHTQEERNSTRLVMALFLGYTSLYAFLVYI